MPILTLRLPDDLLAQIDAARQPLGLSRAAYVQHVLRQHAAFEQAVLARLDALAARIAAAPPPAPAPPADTWRASAEALLGDW